MSINIKGQNISSMSSQDVYIMLLSKEKRDQMHLTAEQKALPYLTGKEMNDLYNNLSLARLIMLVAQRSIGKTDYELEKLTHNLKQLNTWIDEINKGLSKAGEAKKENSDQVLFPPEFEPALTNMAIWAKNNKTNIDIDLKETKDDSGKITGYYVEFPTNPDLATGKIQNVSATLQAEVKNNSTKASKYQSDMSTFLELASTMSKKFSDAIQAVLQRM